MLGVKIIAHIDLYSGPCSSEVVGLRLPDLSCSGLGV